MCITPDHQSSQYRETHHNPILASYHTRAASTLGGPSDFGRITKTRKDLEQEGGSNEILDEVKPLSLTHTVFSSKRHSNRYGTHSTLQQTISSKNK